MKAARFLGTRRMLSRSPYFAKMAVTCASRTPSATLATYLGAQGCGVGTSPRVAPPRVANSDARAAGWGGVAAAYRLRVAPLRIALITSRATGLARPHCSSVGLPYT
jgi:hypothetical protein